MYSYNGTPLSNKTEWAIVICKNIDESKNNYAKLKKLDKKEYILYDSIHIKF